MQKGDYRIFVGAFPTGKIAERIQAVRERYDWKTAQITASHVTLAGTYWRSGLATAENEHDLITKMQKISCSSKSFDMILGGINSFGRRVVYLEVAMTPELTAVRQQLLQLVGPDKHRQRWTPHLTLAMRLKQAQVQQMVRELKEGEWENERFALPIRELALMQRGPTDPAWRCLGQYSLIMSSS
jgi:2'-5' RNA ligase